MGMFQLDRTVHLRSAFKSKGFQVKQTEWETYLRLAEAANKLQDSKRASLHDSLQKVNKKLKTQKVLKTKDYKTDVTISTLLYSLR